MSITTLTGENFNEITYKDGIVMVDCWAEWCSACQSFNPTYEKVAKKYSDHTFTKLDTVAEKTLISELGIEHIPTLMLFRDGILLFQQAGYYEEEKLEDILQQAENIDMDEVKAHIAAEKNEMKKEASH
jgi:thioredoxin 1